MTVTEDEMRAALEDAVRRLVARHLRVAASGVNISDWPAYLLRVADGHGSRSSWLDDQAVEDFLLPVVCRIAAEELRTVAEAIDVDRRVSEARNLGQAQRVAGEARSVVLERADALDPR